LISAISVVEKVWTVYNRQIRHALTPQRELEEEPDQAAKYLYKYTSSCIIGVGSCHLHCFEKKSREMPKRDADTARRRLKAVQEGLRMEKKHGKQL
jgi:hypothetical protein